MLFEAKRTSDACVAAWEKVLANRSDMSALEAARKASEEATGAWREAVLKHGVLVMTDAERGVFSVGTLFSAIVKPSDNLFMGYAADEAGSKAWFADKTSYPWGAWRGGLPIEGVRA